ncbi:GTPase activator activity protein [Tritrichomonas musculus]|uniref:GTPase activator activity protein n=1 Tax=Tritrichomonas musculus TaxID=1915356 RepID=A0ABR2HJV9_9EUKA
MNNQRLLAQLQKPENQICADCQSPNPNYYSKSFGVFICHNCSQIHRSSLNMLNSIVEPIDNYHFTDTDFFYMEKIGNKTSNDYYEFLLRPAERPNPNDNERMTQFIRDKYQNKRWRNILQYSPGSMGYFVLGKYGFFGCFLKGFFKLCQMIYFGAIFLFILSLLLLMYMAKSEKALMISMVNLMIATEIYEALIQNKSLAHIGLAFIIEMIFGLLGFGVYKGFLIATSIKLIGKGVEIGGNGCFLFGVSVLLILLGFGLENLLLVASTFGVIFVGSYFYFNAVFNGRIMFFGYTRPTRRTH